MEKLPGKIWWLLLFAGLLPLIFLISDIMTGALGANAQQAIHIRLGDWSLRFLCLTLTVTPIQTLTQCRGLTDFRQLFGLYTWFYATLHVLGYLLVDQVLAWPVIGRDILESPYLWFGLFGYVIILALGLTSHRWAKQKLGKNWKKLHRLIYWAAVAILLHYFWQLKGNLASPLFYSLIIAMLLVFRVLTRLKRRRKAVPMITAERRKTNKARLTILGLSKLFGRVRRNLS